jgi:hypothetical protein
MDEALEYESGNKRKPFVGNIYANEIRQLNIGTGLQ